jgi:hypothetical protein
VETVVTGGLVTQNTSTGDGEVRPKISLSFGRDYVEKQFHIIAIKSGMFMLDLKTN